MNDERSSEASILQCGHPRGAAWCDLQNDHGGNMHSGTIYGKRIWWDRKGRAVTFSDSAAGMSDSINEQRCPWHGIRGCSPLLNGCSWRPAPPVVTPPRRRVNGHALCTEPSGVPSRACEMYEGHDGPHRLMPAVVTPPAQDENAVEAAERAIREELHTISDAHVYNVDAIIRRYAERAVAAILTHLLAETVPAAPSVSTDRTDEKPGLYSIGSDHWPGVSKLIEELGELTQALGKLIATGGSSEHWDGAGLLDRRIGEEMADVIAAIRFVQARNRVDGAKVGVDIAERAEDKYSLFCRWHYEQEASRG